MAGLSVEGLGVGREVEGDGFFGLGAVEELYASSSLALACCLILSK